MSFLPRKTVVVPIDFSSESVDAIRTALDLVSDRANVHVIHVLLPLEHTAPAVLWGTIDNETRRSAALRHMDSFLKEHEFDGVTAEIKHGDPGLGITAYATDCSADLIVIPSHGYHGVKRFLLGSVAERVIRHAECQVLVLRQSDAC